MTRPADAAAEPREPTTAAGRRVLWATDLWLGSTAHDARAQDILAIEREARAAERSRAEKLESALVHVRRLLNERRPDATVLAIEAINRALLAAPESAASGPAEAEGPG